MTNKERAFIDHYLQTWNATESARLAGYKHPRESGYQLVHKSSLSDEIQRRIAERAMSADEVLDRLAQHARGDFSPFLTSAGEVDLTTEEARNAISLLKKVKVKVRTFGKDETIKEVETEIELHDPQAALVHIGRHFKLFTDVSDIHDERYEKYISALRKFVESGEVANPASANPADLSVA